MIIDSNIRKYAQNSLNNKVVAITLSCIMTMSTMASISAAEIEEQVSEGISLSERISNYYNYSKDFAIRRWKELSACAVYIITFGGLIVQTVSKNKAAAEANQTIAAKEEEKNQAVEDKEAAIAEKNQALEEANRQKEAAITEKDEANRQKEAAIAEKDEANRQKEAAIAEKDEAIRQKEAAITEKDEANRQKEAAIAEKDEANRQKEAAIAEKDEEIIQKNQTIEEQGRTIADKTTENQGLTRRLNNVIPANDKLFKRLISSCCDESSLESKFDNVVSSCLNDTVCFVPLKVRFISGKSYFLATPMYILLRNVWLGTLKIKDINDAPTDAVTSKVQEIGACLEEYNKRISDLCNGDGSNNCRAMSKFVECEEIIDMEEEDEEYGGWQQSYFESGAKSFFNTCIRPYFDKIVDIK